MSSAARAFALILAFVLVAAACSGPARPELSGDATPDQSVGAPTGDATAEATESADDADPVGPAGEAITVGIIMDSSNLMTSIDRQPAVAAAGALAALNEAGGVLGQRVEVVSLDAESRMSVVDGHARRLIEAGAVLLIVTCELDFALPALERASEAGVLVMSPCASEDAWGDGDLGPLAFTMVASADVYGAAMAELLWSEGNRSAAVLWDETGPETRAECDGFLERWAGLGGETTTQTALNVFTADAVADAPDLVAALDTDVIVMCSFSQVGSRILQEVRAAALVTPVFAGLTMDSADFRPADIVGLGDFRMLSFASTRGDDPAPGVADAVERFQEADGIPPASGRFVLGADLATAWASAVEAAGSVDGSLVARELVGLDDLSAASGRVGFGDGQAVTSRSLRILAHVDGLMVFEDTWDG